MTRYCLAALFILFFLQTGHPDTITLTDGKKIEGKLVSIAPAYLLVAIKAGKDIPERHISFDRAKVIGVIDEQGRKIYTGVQPGLRGSNDPGTSDEADFPLVLYMQNLISGEPDSLYLKNGKKYFVQITRASAKYIYVHIDSGSDDNDHEKKWVLNIPLASIEKIKSRGGKVIFDSSIPLRRSVVNYPQVAIQMGVGFFFTHLDKLQAQIQKTYDTVNLDLPSELHAQPIDASYLRMQLSLLMRIDRSLALGFTGSMLGKNDGKLFSGQLRYTLPLKGFGLWMEGGYAFESLKIVQDHRVELAQYYELESVSWESSAQGPVIGLGIDVGETTGFGFYAAAHYLAFPEEETTINQAGDLLPLPEKLQGEIDMSAINMSFGIRYNF